ncbi:MAG: hypothetical protein ACRDDP_00180 [Plesiomonas sp.]
MGFFKKVSKAVSGSVKTIAKGVEQTIRHPLEGPEDLLHGVSEMAHGNFKEGLGDMVNGIKRVADPFHVVGASHQLARPITDPVNKALAQGIKGLTGRNVLGSHPLNAVGTVAASIFTGGAASAAMAGAGFAGAMAAGTSALESAGSTLLSSIGGGLSSIGLDTAGTAVSGAGSTLGSMAASSMAASGTVAGQMGLTGAQAIEMNMGTGLTNAGQAVGSNLFGKALSGAGDYLTGGVSDALAAGTGHALGSFGFADTAAGGSTFVQGTAGEVAKAGVKFGSEGFFSSKAAENIKTGYKVLNAVQSMQQNQQQQLNNMPQFLKMDMSDVKLQNTGSTDAGNTGYLTQADIVSPSFNFDTAGMQFA